MTNVKIQMSKFRIPVIVIILLFSSVTLSHARATVESLPQIEKLFLQGKYDRVAYKTMVFDDWRKFFKVDVAWTEK